LKKVTIYLSEEELAALKSIATKEEEVRLLAVAGAKPGQRQRRRDAPPAPNRRKRASGDRRPLSKQTKLLGKQTE